MSEKQELAYQRKARLRKKHRKVKLSLVSNTANLNLAVKNSRRGKEGKKGVVIFDRDPNGNILRLQQSINDGTYHTSPGHDCMRLCPCGKVRKLHKLPYYPDHVGQHALMQVLMPHLVKALYIESGASVKGRGMMYAKRRTERWIDEHKSYGRIYFIKLDFVKFYENVDQQQIYQSLCDFFTDPGIRHLLHEVIFALPQGLGIGLYPIQTLTNFYMSILCRLICGTLNVKVEIYCDDMVILGTSKKQVWQASNRIFDYAARRMYQPLHTNIGMQIIDETHFLDYVGYRFYFNHTTLRKRMKQKFKKKMHNLVEPMRRYQVAMSYKGWLMHCQGFNLWKNVTKVETYNDFQMPVFDEVDAQGKRIFQGRKGSIAMIINQPITLKEVEFDVKSTCSKNGLTNLMQVEYNGALYKMRSCNSYLRKQLEWLVENKHLPLRGWKFINWNMTGVGNPDYRLVRPDWTPAQGF